jgi:hypothetical protein
MEHWEAWCNLGGSLLGALGGLYLTYDILGGKDGPLAGVTRVVTYVALFGVTYSLGLGLKFGLIASLGMGVILGFDFYWEARRVRAKAKPRHWITEVAFGSTRALALSLGLMAITNGQVFLFLFPIYALFISGTYLMGWSPADNRKISRHLVLRASNFWVSVIRGLGAWLSFRAAISIVSAMGVQTFSFAPAWRVGLTVGGTSFVVGSITPWVEWWVERLSRRWLAVVGVAFAILGFLIQALPNWIVLLQ